MMKRPIHRYILISEREISENKNSGFVYEVNGLALRCQHLAATPRWMRDGSHCFVTLLYDWTCVITWRGHKYQWWTSESFLRTQEGRPTIFISSWNVICYFVCYEQKPHASLLLSLVRRKNTLDSFLKLFSFLSLQAHWVRYSILFYPIILEGRRRSTNDFEKKIPFHLVLFSAALAAKSIPVHS